MVERSSSHRRPPSPTAFANGSATAQRSSTRLRQASGEEGVASLSDAVDPRVKVETAVERKDALHPMSSHDRDVNGIASAAAPHPAQDDLRQQQIGSFDGHDLVRDADQRVERGLNRCQPANGGVAMQDLLQDLRIGDQALLGPEKVVQSPPSAAPGAPTRPRWFPRAVPPAAAADIRLPPRGPGVDDSCR